MTFSFLPCKDTGIWHSERSLTIRMARKHLETAMCVYLHNVCKGVYGISGCLKALRMLNACGKGYTFSHFIRYHGLLLLETVETLESWFIRTRILRYISIQDHTKSLRHKSSFLISPETKVDLIILVLSS